MKVLYSNLPLFGELVASPPNDAIFLAGPTPRSPDVLSWRPDALKILESMGFEGIVLVPEWDTGLPRISYDDQVEWERAGLTLAKAIVFWVPRNMATMPALTTNVEFGYWLAKTPEKVVYGRPPAAPSTRYLDWLLLKDRPDAVIHDSLESVLEAAVYLVENT